MGGTLVGSGSLTSFNETFIQTSATKYIDMMTLYNDANALWSDGNIIFSNGATITNNLNATFSISTPAGEAFCGVGPQIINLGLLRKIGNNASSTTFFCDFQNYGLVHVEGGNLQITQGTNWNTFSVQTGAVLTTVTSADSVFVFDQTSLVEVNGTLSIGGNTVFLGVFTAQFGKISLFSGIADFRAEATLINMGKTPFDNIIVSTHAMRKVIIIMISLSLSPNLYY